MAQPILALSGLSRRYGATVALDGMDLEVAEGRFFALFGPSSVGKTTTLRAICGLVRPDAGTIRIDGRDVTHAEIRGRGVAMVFQSFALYPHLTVAQNLAYPLKEAGVAAAEIRRRIADTTEMLRIAHRLGNKPGTLSGGEQQRLALGRALIAQPRILLLDEPLTNLDAKLRHDMRAELKRLHRDLGTTIVYATPDELEALSMGEEIAVMEHGRVVQKGTPDSLYDRPTSVYVAAKIGSPHMNLYEGRVTADARAVATALGPIPVAHAGLAPGAPVTLGVRPADVRPGAAPEGAAAVDAAVSLIEPLGDVTIVSLATEGQPLRVLVPEARASHLRRGDRFPVAIAARDVHLFRPGDGAAIERPS
ncbi:ABC transporter ATP-binding protein [Amaricoccus sp.]|uniref:ABC transporter ATP-binding protein n=1 Tax=Amaricoccus sp. TaxID=1872485 RepID=UPI001B493026|nr:ABC transporter ATP-binding protein [Amaricoccus sp.]MBP7000106.1 ABC transporter ATP-binding protein [Amaricoccus sp.]